MTWILNEVCSCDAQVDLAGESASLVMRAAQEWRDGHEHDMSGRYLTHNEKETTTPRDVLAPLTKVALLRRADQVHDRMTQAASATDWNQCPNCKSSRIVADTPLIEELEAWQEVMCENCGSSWTETYIAVGRENVKYRNV